MKVENNSTFKYAIYIYNIVKNKLILFFFCFFLVVLRFLYPKTFWGEVKNKKFLPAKPRSFSDQIEHINDLWKTNLKLSSFRAQSVHQSCQWRHWIDLILCLHWCPAFISPKWLHQLPSLLQIIYPTPCIPFGGVCLWNIFWLQFFGVDLASLIRLWQLCVF